MRRLLHSIFDKSGATHMPQEGVTGTLPALSGGKIDRYRLEYVIGEGHTSIVYLATDDRHESVALKVLDPGRVRRPKFRERLEADIRTVAGLSHPHILPVYQFGISEQGWIYIAMAIAARGTLKQLSYQGALDRSQAQDILEAVARALHSAHELGVVHHDVKLSNILFDESGRVLLGDFGAPRTSYGLLGTPGYIAPEEILGLNLDRRVDVHAVAGPARVAAEPEAAGRGRSGPGPCAGKGAGGTVLHGSRFRLRPCSGFIWSGASTRVGQTLSAEPGCGRPTFVDLYPPHRAV